MKLSVWYHARISDGYAKIKMDDACQIMAEQMKALKDSGLLDAADELHIGINGSESDAEIAKLFCPFKSQIINHGQEACSELPTISSLRQWALDHPDWFVLYHHIKGVTYPPGNWTHNWRRCMQRNVVANWKQCVSDLEQGYESVGAHWLTREQYGAHVKHPFWGGNFWWATTAFLSSLPKLPRLPKTEQDRFLAEAWIGMGPRAPRIKDYAPHWPNPGLCFG